MTVCSLWDVYESLKCPWVAKLCIAMWEKSKCAEHAGKPKNLYDLEAFCQKSFAQQKVKNQEYINF